MKTRQNTNQAIALGDNLLIKLLEIEINLSKMYDELRRLIGGKFEIDGLFIDGTLDVVLDALGIPADNTVETNACDIANSTGIWPSGAYCRDYYYYEWLEEMKSAKPNPKRYIAWVRKVGQ